MTNISDNVTLRSSAGGPNVTIRLITIISLLVLFFAGSSSENARADNCIRECDVACQRCLRIFGHGLSERCYSELKYCIEICYGVR